MAHQRLNRDDLILKPLSEREDRVFIEDYQVPIDAEPKNITAVGRKLIDETVAKLITARDNGKSRMLTFGAHTIKNGLAPVLIKLIEDGWVTHLATNGAGIIHDWEFAFQGHSSEHVAENVTRGLFGAWEETGFYLNLAICLGAWKGLGYGESVGVMVEEEGLELPCADALEEGIKVALSQKNYEQAAAGCDLLQQIKRFELAPGIRRVAHPYKAFGVQAAAYRHGIPFTSHPMFGHDIIYIHPMNHGAAIGRTAERDFLSFANAVCNLDGGVYMSIGSAVMSPMVFEKSLSMAQNLAIQKGEHLDDHHMVVVDLQESHWDWTQGEPPEDNPDYYLRFNKSFNRMGGDLRYLQADNRDFLLAVLQGLDSKG